MPLLVGPWQYRPIGARGNQCQPIATRRVSRPPALPGINGHSQIPTDGSTLMRILWMRSGLNGKNGKRIVQLLKPINSSHNPNPIPNLWLGFSKDPKVLRNKDLPPSPRPKVTIHLSHLIVHDHWWFFITTILYYKLFFDLQWGRKCQNDQMKSLRASLHPIKRLWMR